LLTSLVWEGTETGARRNSDNFVKIRIRYRTEVKI